MGNESSQQLKYGEELANDIQVSWKKINAGESFPSRDGHCACAVGSRMYVFGGVVCTADGEHQESNEMLLFDTDTLKMSKVDQKGEVPLARSSASMSAVGKKLYLFGGISQETGWFSLEQTSVFDTETNTWSKLDAQGTCPCPRDKLASTTMGNKIYVFGGFGPTIGEDVEEVEEFSEEDEDVVTEIEEQQEAAQFGWFNDLFILDTVSQTWSSPMQMNLGVPTPRAALGMCAVDKYLVIFGGKDSVGRQNDIYIFDTESRKWVQDVGMSGRQPEPRSFHTLTTVKHRVVVYGGRGLQNQHFSNIDIFDTKTREWLQPSVEGDVPSGRAIHSTTLVGDHLVVYGGSADFNPETMQCSKYFNHIYMMTTGDLLSGSATEMIEKGSKSGNGAQKRRPESGNNGQTSLKQPRHEHGGGGEPAPKQTRYEEPESSEDS